MSSNSLKSMLTSVKEGSMDRVVYYFENGMKRVEEVTEAAWLAEIASIKGFEKLVNAEEAVTKFNQFFKDQEEKSRVTYFRVVR